MSATMEKAWGTTISLIKTPLIEVHRIEVRPEKNCSWHCHKRKWNAFVLISGGGLIIEHNRPSGIERIYISIPGDCCTVSPGEFHRFQSGWRATVALEIYYPDILSSEDIIRDELCGRAAELVNYSR